MPHGSTCQEDIQAAQQASQGGECTQNTMMMACPHDTAVTYQAQDGCQISELQSRGWTQVDTNGDNGDVPDDGSFPGGIEFPGDNLPPASDFIPEDARDAVEKSGAAVGLAWLIGLV